MYWNVVFWTIPLIPPISNQNVPQNSVGQGEEAEVTPADQLSSQHQGIQINLTEADLLRVGYKNNKKPWSQDEDDLLRHYSKNNRLSWKQIALKIPGRTYKMCYSRYRRLMNPLKEQWTHVQNQKIKEMAITHNFDWKKISQSFKHRNAKQIKEHYENYLQQDGDRKEWDLEDDLRLLDLLRKYGTDWAAIQAHMDGRIKCQIKNRYYGHLKRIQRKKIEDQNKKKH